MTANKGGLLMGNNYKYGKTKKKCCQCSGELSGLRTRFCSDTCSDQNAKERAERKYNLLRKFIEDRICITCKERYTPRTTRQECCSRSCREIYIIRARREARLKNRANFTSKKCQDANKHFLGSLSNKIMIQGEDQNSNLDNSDFKNQIEEYFKKGGKVTRISPTIGRSPSVGIPLNFGGWTPETLIGFGDELDLVEYNVDPTSLYDL